MATELYDLTVPVFVRALGNLAAILEKGAAFAAEKGIDPDVLLQARLFEDMAPLTAQIQRASDTAKGAVVRLGGVPNESFEDIESSFPELQARIARTIAFIQAVPREAIDGREQAEILIKTPGGDFPFIGETYVLNFVLPNLFFHVTTAYALLRHHGVPIGKRDYLGG